MSASIMSSLISVLRKEIVDHLRDRRALMSALLFPLLGPVLAGVVFSAAAGWVKKDRPLELAVIGREHAPSLITYLERSGATIQDAPSDYEEEIRAGKLDCALIIPDDYAAEYSAGKTARIELIVDNSQNAARTPVMRTERLIENYSRLIGGERLLARGVSPELASVVRVDEVDLATAEALGARALELIPLFIIFAAFIGGMHIAIDTTAGERERGSLEPLLVNPVQRGALVTGKWLSTVMLAAIAVCVCLAAFRVLIARVPLHDLGIKARMDTAEMGAILAAVLPLSFFSSSLQMLIATYARSFKEAQTYLQALQTMPMLPGVVMMVYPLQPKPWMNVVPILSQNLIIHDIMRGSATATPFLLAILGCAIGSMLCLFLTTRLLGQERIIFGR